MMALVLGPRAAGAGIGPEAGSVLLDTSVIIDGRITDIAQTGFLRDKLLVPHFVLAELQYIADSSDGLRRNRGRRGMEVLNLLQKEPLCNIEFIDEDVPDITEVDMKLIRLARNRNAAIMTNDYNLNRVAQLEGVKILNLNNLANALKPVVIPGEETNVRVIKEGSARAVLLPLEGRTVIDWTLSALRAVPEVAEVVVVLSHVTPSSVGDSLVARPEEIPRSFITARSWLEAVESALESATPSKR